MQTFSSFPCSFFLSHAQYFIYMLECIATANYLRGEKMSIERDKNVKIMKPLIFITFFSLSSLLLLQLAVLVYRHYVHKNLTSINFDNPVYRKTTEDQVRLKKSLSPIIYPSTVGEELRALAHDCPI